MRWLLVALTTTLVLVASCGESEAQKNAAAAQEMANQLLEKAQALEEQLANVESERNTAQALADRRKAASNTITTFVVRIVLHTSLAPGATLQFPSRGIFGGLRMERSDGGSLSLGETGGQSAVRSGTTDQYHIAFEYEPDTSQPLVGQSITGLQTVQALTAPYERLLSHTGLSLANGGTADVTVRLNGFDVVNATFVPVSLQSDGTARIPLEEYFANLFERYSDVVERRQAG
jgi:hypothetical protein